MNQWKHWCWFQATLTKKTKAFDKGQDNSDLLGLPGTQLLRHYPLDNHTLNRMTWVKLYLRLIVISLSLSLSVRIKIEGTTSSFYTIWLPTLTSFCYPCLCLCLCLCICLLYLVDKTDLPLPLQQLFPPLCTLLCALHLDMAWRYDDHMRMLWPYDDHMTITSSS